MLLDTIGVLYRNILKPLLFLMSPDRAHKLIISVMAKAGRAKPICALSTKMFGKKYNSLETEFRGIHFSSPVGLSAGLDKNGQTVPIISTMGFGFTEVGSVTAEPCKGNDGSWFHRLPADKSLVVHAGLANQGVKQILKRVKEESKYYSSSFPVIMSVARNNSPCVVTDEDSIADYVKSIKQAQKSKYIKMIEINISCPNAFGGEQFTRPTAFKRLMAEVKKCKVKKPLVIKMPSDLKWAEFKKLIDIALEYDISIFAISNLAKDRTLITKSELPDDVRGGLSGKPVQKLSDNLIKKTYAHYKDKVTIIGIGGIFNAEDAYRKIRLGATYVELITGMIFEGPQLIATINRDINEMLKKDNLEHISQAVGLDARK